MSFFQRLCEQVLLNFVQKLIEFDMVFIPLLVATSIVESTKFTFIAYLVLIRTVTKIKSVNPFFVQRKSAWTFAVLTIDLFFNLIINIDFVYLCACVCVCIIIVLSPTVLVSMFLESCVGG